MEIKITIIYIVTLKKCSPNGTATTVQSGSSERNKQQAATKLHRKTDR